jgi:hypothetical protein
LVQMMEQERLKAVAGCQGKQTIPIERLGDERPQQVLTRGGQLDPGDGK